MRINITPTFSSLFFTLVWLLAGRPLLAAEMIPPTPAEVRKIEAALPDRPTVAAAKPRRILVFSRAWGYQHSSIPFGKTMMETMARKTGAFEVTIDDDLARFESQELNGFDAVFFNNTNNEIFLPEKLEELSSDDRAAAKKRDERLKQNLVAFLAGGKGLAVLHAGLASFREWPEFGQIVGARFDNHPWVAGSTVTLKVDDRTHPLARAFPEARFQITDEIYQVTGDYSRDKLRVLLSLDTERTDMKKGTAVHRTDGDFALSWVKSYGKGRVFYCALGHQHDIFWNPVVLRHLLDGFQFVLGDLTADTTPSGAKSRSLPTP